MSKNRKYSNQHYKIRPKELRQRHMSQKGASNLRSDSNSYDAYDDVFVESSDDVFRKNLNISAYQHQRNKSYRGHFERKLSQGFKHTRDQLRRMKYVNKQKEAENSKLFIFNVSKRYTIDDIYTHFIGNEVKVKDLWQSSHKDARKQSFVILVPKADTEYIKDDEVLENLGIRVRDYKERKDSTF